MRGKSLASWAVYLCFHVQRSNCTIWLVQRFWAKMHDCDFKSGFFHFSAFGKISKSRVLKSQSNQKHVLVMDHLSWNTKTRSKHAWLPLLVLILSLNYPCLYFKISILPGSLTKKKKSLTKKYTVFASDCCWLLASSCLLGEEESWRIEILVGSCLLGEEAELKNRNVSGWRKEWYLMGIGKKRVDEKKKNRKKNKKWVEWDTCKEIYKNKNYNCVRTQ